MAYKSKDDLPERIKTHLPKRAQEAYKRAYDATFDGSKVADDIERMQTATKAAWDRLEAEYGDKAVIWRREAEA